MSAFASDSRQLARTAGLKDLRVPDLEQVDRRRAQLWGLSLLVAVSVPLIVVAAGFNLLSDDLLDVFESRNVRLAMLAMLVTVLGYVAEREVTLRRLTGMLVEERVLTASLVNRVDEVNLLLRATQAMNSALDLKAVMSQIAESAHTLLNAGSVSILLVDPDDAEVLVVAATTGDADVQIGMKQPIGDGLAGGAITRGDALLIDSGEAELPKNRRQTGDVLVAPMRIRGALVGVIRVDTGEARTPFSEFDLRGVSVFADAAAAAISNARAFEEQLGQVANLLEQDRAKNEFLTLVTHELRTPLTSMIGLMSTMARPGVNLPPEKVSELAEIAKNQGWRLDRLIENLLETSRRNEGAVNISPEPTDVGSFIDRSVQGLRRALPSHPITFDMPTDMHYGVDTDALARILDNLLSNAAKYTAEGSRVDVSLTPTDNGLCLRVADHGGGLDTDEFGDLFKKFSRGNDPFDRGGLGLGLYVVKALSEAHGGRVTVSETPGGGATFDVYLAAKAVQLQRPA